jgi:hypothetical protein
MPKLNWVESPIKVQALQWTGNLQEFQQYAPDAYLATEGRVGIKMGSPVQSVILLYPTEWAVAYPDGHVEAMNDMNFHKKFVEGQDTALTITSLEPATGEAGAQDVTMLVNGTGFTNFSAIFWNGGEERTTFVHDGQLSTIVKLSMAEPSENIVVVKNPLQKSGELTFSITAPPPPPEE